MINQMRGNALVKSFVLVAMMAGSNWGCDEGNADGAIEIDGPSVLNEGGDLEEGELDGLLHDGEVRFGEGVTLFSEVDAAGMQLMFLNVVEPDTGKQSLLLIEGGQQGAIGLNVEPVLADASLLDIFLAVTEPAVAIPDELLGQEDHHLGARGWFVDKVLRGEHVAPRGVCVGADFQDALRNVSPEIDGGEFWRLNFSPGGGNLNWYGPGQPDLGIQCTNCQDIWYHYNANSQDWDIGNVDANKQAIAICSMGSRPTICANSGCISHLGPTIQFWYRTEGNASMHLLFQSDLPAGTWYYRTTPWTGDSSDNDRDWRISIDHALDADNFHLGYIWEHLGL